MNQLFVTFTTPIATEYKIATVLLSAYDPEYIARSLEALAKSVRRHGSELDGAKLTNAGLEPFRIGESK